MCQTGSLFHFPCSIVYTAKEEKYKSKIQIGMDSWIRSWQNYSFLDIQVSSVHCNAASADQDGMFKNNEKRYDQESKIQKVGIKIQAQRPSAVSPCQEYGMQPNFCSK